MHRRLHPEPKTGSRGKPETARVLLGGAPKARNTASACRNLTTNNGKLINKLRNNIKNN